MANELKTTIRAYTADDIQIKRFLRVDEARQCFKLEEEVLLIVAFSADAYLLSFLLNIIKKLIQGATGNKSVGLIFKPVEVLISENVYIATKTAAITAEGFWKDLETSLTNLKTDYIYLYQFHNPAVCPKSEDEGGLCI